MDKSLYSYKIMFLKGVKYFVIFCLPVLADKFVVAFPEVAQLTLGALLVMGINYLKNYVGVKVP